MARKLTRLTIMGDLRRERHGGTFLYSRHKRYVTPEYILRISLKISQYLDITCAAVMIYAAISALI